MTEAAGVTMILEGATVLVGPDLQPREVSVVVKKDRIESLTDAGETDAGETARESEGELRRIDVSGLTLMPGFIDAHVHIGFYEPHDVLRGGVTTVRDLAWPPEEILPLSRDSKDPSFDGPEILTAGPMLTAPGGYPTRAGWAPPGTGREVVGAEEAVAAVTRLAAAGVDVIKVALNEAAGPTLPLGVLAAVVRRAHELGLKVTGHVTGLAELDKAVAAGMDELAHMLKGLDPIPNEVIGQMVRQGMTIVPTLAPLAGDELEIATDNVRRFLAAGGQVIYGTDLGDAGPKPGIDPLETERMADAGMSVREIIASATTSSSRWLGLEDRGVIEPGRRADIVGFPEPLSVESLAQPTFVVHRGTVVRDR